MCGVASSVRIAVFDILNALCLVGVGEPVLAHEHVVGEADSSASHEDLGNRKTARHIGVVSKSLEMRGNGMRLVWTWCAKVGIDVEELVVEVSRDCQGRSKCAVL